MNAITSFPSRSKRRRYSQQERDAIVAQARRMRAEGMKMAAIVHELGISTLTLSKWFKAANPQPAFLPVHVVAPVVGNSSPSGVCMVTPAGYRIEGLSMDMLVALLSRIG